MKITIEKEFSSVGEAAAWLQRVTGNVTLPPRQDLPSDEHKGKVGEDKPTRKPRNDAGKPRGPYKVNGEASASEPTKVGVDSAAPVVAATPTPPKPVAPGQVVEGAASPAQPAATAPTKEDALAALKRLSTTEGFGMEACRRHLTEFKVNRLSELDPKMYPLFIKQIDDKLAKGAE